MGNVQTDFKENRVLSIDMGMVKYYFIHQKLDRFRLSFGRKNAC
jgi:hypothetical protein